MRTGTPEGVPFTSSAPFWRPRGRQFNRRAYVDRNCTAAYDSRKRIDLEKADTDFSTAIRSENPRGEYRWADGLRTVEPGGGGVREIRGAATGPAVVRAARVARVAQRSCLRPASTPASLGVDRDELRPPFECPLLDDVSRSLLDYVT